MLIDTYGASINVTNKRGDTPLHLAAAAGYTDMVEQLTSYPQCDLNIENRSSDKPDLAAEFGGHTAIADYIRSLIDVSGNSTFLFFSCTFNKLFQCAKR